MTDMEIWYMAYLVGLHRGATPAVSRKLANAALKDFQTKEVEVDGDLQRSENDD